MNTTSAEGTELYDVLIDAIAHFEQLVFEGYNAMICTHNNKYLVNWYTPQ
jgi:hypothetical protein